MVPGFNTAYLNVTSKTIATRIYQKSICLVNDINDGSIRFHEACKGCRKKTPVIRIKKARGKNNGDELLSCRDTIKKRV